MRRLLILSLALVLAVAAAARAAGYTNRTEALAGIASDDASRRAQAVIWIADNGTAADAELLRQRLADASPTVRRFAEQGLWVLWSRSGDKAIDALLARGVEEMQAEQFGKAIATFSEIIRRKPGFAEGWNKRATVYFLAGEYRKSLADCDEVIKRNPHHFGALAGYGHIYFRLKQYDKAIRYWRRALDENPNLTGVEDNIESAEQLLAEQRRHST